MKIYFVYITKQSRLAQTKLPNIVSLCEPMISLEEKVIKAW